MSSVRGAVDGLDLPEETWTSLATTVHNEITELTQEAVDRLRVTLLIPPERYVEELSAFQSWMDFGHSESGRPEIVRAQVMTELYVAFVWLRDSLMAPLAQELSPQTSFSKIERHLSTGRRRLLRNAVAHGRWCYLPGFDGLEFWAQPNHAQPHERFEISGLELGLLQILSRGTAIAALLALTKS